MLLPIELARQIITTVLDVGSSSGSDEPGATSKPDWALVQHLSLASKAYRTLTLEAWFRITLIKSPDDMPYIRAHWPEIGNKWARSLHIIEHSTRTASKWDIGPFTRARALRLDWLYTTSAYGRVPELVTVLNAPPSLTEFDVRGLAWPSPGLVRSLAGAFPQLRVLRLRQAAVWCGLCYTCVVPSFLPPGPDALRYEGGVGLPRHYAEALAELAHLHTVSLSVGKRGDGHTALGGPAGNPHMWIGECDTCMRLLYGDDAFRERWLAGKRGADPDAKGPWRESPLRPPNLRLVEWDFWENEDEDEEEAGESAEVEAEADVLADEDSADEDPASVE